VRGSWRSDNYAYALWSDWVGSSTHELAPEAARADLALRYLRAYGPATAADLKWWAGWTVRETSSTLASLGDAVIPVHLVQAVAAPDPAYLLAEEAPALLSTDPDSAPGIRLLPVWDAYLMGYGMGYPARSRYLSHPDHYALIYDAAGNCTSTLLIDGIAAGVWEFDYTPTPPGGTLTIRVAPFSSFASDRWTEIEQAAARLAAAIAATDLQVERAPRSRPLAEGARNAFLSPLRLGKSS
jgi:hypothetical protein